MSNKCNIIKISSQYCLKSIFSYIEYNKVLQIVKYNKRIQKKLELEVSHYKEYSKYYKLNCYYKIKSRKFKKFFYNTLDELHNNFAVNFLFFLFILLFFSLIGITTLLIKRKIFDDNNLKDLTKNWKLNPIEEINLLSDSKTEKIKSLGLFKGINKNIKKQEIFIWEGQKFIVSYNSNKLIYQDLINGKNKKLCGYDSFGNKLFFPENINCPINYIEITNSQNPSISNLLFKTISISNNKYLHYTNEYIKGEILVDFKIGSFKGICEFKNFDSEFSSYFKNYNLKDFNKGCQRDSYDNSYSIIDNNTIENLLFDNNLQEALNYLIMKNSSIYLFKRTYKGYFAPNYNEVKFIIKAKKNIKIINYSLFGFIGYCIISIIILYKLFSKFCEFDEKNNKKIKIIVLFIIIILFILYGSILIYKLIIEIKLRSLIINLTYPLNELYNQKKTPWFIRCNYVLIVFTFLFDFYLILLVVFYSIYAGNEISKLDKFNELISFNNIDIISYILPNDFHEYDKFKKKAFLLEHLKEFKYCLSKEQIKLIRLLNKFRRNHKLPNFIYDLNENIPKILIEPLSSIILFEQEKIFKISNKEYLLRYLKNEFIENFKNKKEEIIDILLKEDLVKIIIIKQGKYEYYFFSEENTFNNNDKESSLKIYKEQKYYDSINLSVQEYF